MLDLVRVEVRWDGSRLLVRTVFGQGWELLTESERPPGRQQQHQCAALTDMTSFQLEAALYAAMREIGDNWQQARFEVIESRQLSLAAEKDS